MSIDPHPPLGKGKETATFNAVQDGGEHKKRRRNRTIQSCVSCHTAKRMCNRQRPSCLRCTTLGLTGLCVYEVDDPAQKLGDMQQDETFHLRSRVAELESVIREMKNKPHPRWAKRTLGMKGYPNRHSSQIRGSSSSPELRDIPISPTASAASGSNMGRTPPPTPPSIQTETPSADSISPLQSPLPNLLSADSLTPLAASKAFKTLSSLATHYTGGTALSGFTYDMSPQSSMPTTPWADSPPFSFNGTVTSSSMSDGTDSENGTSSHSFEQIIQANENGSAVVFDYHGAAEAGTCACLGNNVAYNTMLELSPHLRKAAQILGQLSEHFPGTDCALLTKITELDILASYSTALWKSVDLPEQRHEEQMPPFGKLTHSHKLHDSEPSHTNRSTVPVSLSSGSHHHPQNWGYQPTEGSPMYRNMSSL